LKVFNGIESYDSPVPTAITTGTFDGVHKGHRKILDQLISEARSINGKSVLVTFSPHPRLVLFPDSKGPLLLTTMEERMHLLEDTGLDHLIVHPFSRDFSRIPALNYIRDYLVGKLNMQRLVIGYDHQFGRNREGSIDELREMAPLYSFEVTEIPAQDVDEVSVSSTKVRKALAAGDIQLVSKYLGYEYFVQGTVVKGHQRGRQLGFPTANLKLNSEWKLIPKRGVYAVRVEMEGQSYDGMLNIGVNPTFGTEGRETLEAHLLNFDSDIYGAEMVVTFIDRLRDEAKFESADELVQQIERDKQQAILRLTS